MKIVTMGYWIITWLLFVVSISSIRDCPTTAVVLWVAYIGMLVLNISGKVIKENDRQTISKKEQEIKRISKG